MRNKNNINLKWRPKKCSECGGELVEMLSYHPDGVPYRYWHCVKCDDEFLDMVQLGKAAEIYRKLKTAKISKWGSAIAIRIPKEIAQKQKLKAGYKVQILPEKNGFRIITGKANFKVIPEKD